MCIIVDANRLGVVLKEREDFAPIQDWLERGDGILVYSTGEKFATEVGRKARAWLVARERAGRARLVPGAEFADDESELRKSRDLKSDDPHVLALARKSGARLLYTGDQDLMADFKNKRFIDKPRGKVYSGAANADLLDKLVCPQKKQ